MFVLVQATVDCTDEDTAGRVGVDVRQRRTGADRGNDSQPSGTARYARPASSAA
jgi:hypothetical protein